MQLHIDVYLSLSSFWWPWSKGWSAVILADFSLSLCNYLNDSYEFHGPIISLHFLPFLSGISPTAEMPPHLLVQAASEVMQRVQRKYFSLLDAQKRLCWHYLTKLWGGKMAKLRVWEIRRSILSSVQVRSEEADAKLRPDRASAKCLETWIAFTYYQYITVYSHILPKGYSSHLFRCIAYIDWTRTDLRFSGPGRICLKLWRLGLFEGRWVAKTFSKKT